MEISVTDYNNWIFKTAFFSLPLRHFIIVLVAIVLVAGRVGLNPQTALTLRINGS
jgi:hypothetical protein